MKRCPNCGKEVNSSDLYCNECGSSLKSVSLSKDLFNNLADVLEQINESSPDLKTPKITIKKKKYGFKISWKKDTTVDGYDIYIYKDKEGKKSVEHRQIFDTNKNYAIFTPSINDKFYVKVCYLKIKDNIIYESEYSEIKKLH